MVAVTICLCLLWCLVGSFKDRCAPGTTEMGREKLALSVQDSKEQRVLDHLCRS